jgi:hypothetical protein
LVHNYTTELLHRNIVQAHCTLHTTEAHCTHNYATETLSKHGNWSSHSSVPSSHLSCASHMLYVMGKVCASACALTPTQTLVWQPTCKTEPPHFFGCWQVTQVSMPLASTHPRPSSPATPPVTPHATPRRSGCPSEMMQS